MNPTKTPKARAHELVQSWRKLHEDCPQGAVLLALGLILSYWSFATIAWGIIFDNILPQSIAEPGPVGGILFGTIALSLGQGMVAVAKMAELRKRVAALEGVAE